MHRSYLIENYLENIYMLSVEKGTVRHKDVKDKMSRAKSVVTKALRILEEKGYIIYDTDKIIQLTDEGSFIARRVHEKHLYIKKLLVNSGINEEIAEKEACDIEHVLSYDSFRLLKEYTEKQKCK